MDFNIFSFTDMVFAAMISSPLMVLVLMLVSFLMFTHYSRHNGDAIEGWDGEDWFLAIIASIFFPVTYWYWFKEFVYPHLVKEWGKKKISGTEL